MAEKINRQTEFDVISSNQYSASPGDFDEFVTDSGQIKEAWKNIWPKIHQGDVYSFQKRQVLLEDIIKDNGITYNIHNQGDAGSRLWMMDQLPIVFSSSEIDFLYKGLKQRLILLNKIIKDFYGEQKLLKKGIYPAKLLLGSPSFLRPCCNILNEDQSPLHFYATDLARSSSGDWWVMSDRIDAASGLGYAMENRYVSGRVFSNIFSEGNILPIKTFLESFRYSLTRHAPQGVKSPLIVVLTPGPLSETYFEHSYLAKTMGFELVQGTDLTVRNQKLYLKTIEGLRQVHVILRRVDSEWCDPLELRDDSLLGIPGLMQAVRSRNVVVSNFPGCAVAETPALMAFLPSMCRFLLGEDPMIPSVATWWCGQSKERDFVLDKLETLIVKPAFGYSKQFRPIYCEKLGKDELVSLKQEIYEKPEYFCAQQSLALSTTPYFNGYGIEPRKFLTRAFLFKSPDDSISILPGGLGRVSARGHDYDFSMQKGGVSKDVWISDESGKCDVAPPPPEYSYNCRSVILSSHLADNLYWLGRYAERSEVIARTITMVLKSILEESNKEDIQSALYLMCSRLPDMESELINIETGDISNFYDILGLFIDQFVSDENNLESLVSIIQNLNRTKSTVIERISGNTTSNLMSADKFLKDFKNFKAKSDFTKIYKCLIEFLDVLSSFSGMIAENITRGPDWYFLSIGKRLERCFGLNQILTVFFSKSFNFDNGNLRGILDYSDSSVTYRQRHLNNLRASLVIDLVVREKSNPRSIAFQADNLKKYLDFLPDLDQSELMVELKDCADLLYSKVRCPDLTKRMEFSNTQGRSEFCELNHEIFGLLHTYSDLITKKYFIVT